MTAEEYRILKETMLKRASRPAREQIEEMIRRGAIDRDGNVLIRRPEPPWEQDPQEVDGKDQG